MEKLMKRWMKSVACVAVIAIGGCACGGSGKGTGVGIGSGTGAGTGTSTGTGAAGAAVHPEKVVQINQTGELVDIEASFVPGYVTIVDFWAEWCGACKVMEEKFMAEIADEPRILVRKVDVGDGDTPVAEHYDIGPLPHLRVYGVDGKLRYILMNNQALETGAKALEVLAEAGAR